MYSKIIYIKRLKTVKCIKYKPYLLSGQNYHKVEQYSCWDDKYGLYDSVEDAKAACSLDANCQAVSQSSCDESLNEVFLCPFGASYVSGSVSCIYEKTGISY